MIRELNSWHAVVEHGRKEWGINLPENPVHLVKRPKADPARERRLEPTDGEGETEEDWLLAACDSDRDRWMGAIVRLAIETAMRQGEILGLKWADVDLRKPVAVLHDTKNGDKRVVPLSLRAKKVLEGLPRYLSGLVFPIDQNTPSRCAFGAAVTALGSGDCVSMISGMKPLPVFSNAAWK